MDKHPIKADHEIRTLKLSKLTPASYNPRVISKEAAAGLGASLDRFGLVDPLVVNKRGGKYTIVGGHQRYYVMKERGVKEARVVLVDLSEAEERSLNVVLNNQHIMGDWNNDALVSLLDQIRSDNAVDFDGLMLNKLLEELGMGAGKAGLTDPDDVPEIPKEPITKLGDVWKLGEHMVMCGNSLIMDQVKILMGKESIDCVFTDPPYGINAVKVNGKRLGSIGGAKAFGAVGGGGRKGTYDPFGGAKNLRGRVHGPARNAIIEPNLYAPVIGDDSTDSAISAYHICVDLKIPLMFFWGGNYYADKLPPSRCWIVWDKENTGSFADGELAWTNIDAPLRIFRHMWSGLMKASERGESRVHPTQKPVALAVWVLTELGKESKVVMDLFGGSGSTLIACEQTKRKCFMMELSPAYVDVIKTRWENFTGQKAELIKP